MIFHVNVYVNVYKICKRLQFVFLFGKTIDKLYLRYQ